MIPDHYYFNKITQKMFKNFHGFFVQIGSGNGLCDNVMKDFIFQKWSGLLMIDTVPENVEKLKKLFKQHKNVKVYRLAIDNTKGLKNFYVNYNDSPFDKKNIKSKITRTSTLPSFLSENNILKIDILNIDAMGHDFCIIKSLDLNTLRPRIIYFNHTFFDKHRPIEYLSYFNYKCITDRLHTVAWDGNK